MSAEGDNYRDIMRVGTLYADLVKTINMELGGTPKLGTDGTAVTSTGAEINILDGVTATAAELNICDDPYFLFPVQIPGTWGYDADAKNGGWAGCDQALDVTATEAASTFAKVYDLSATEYQDLATSATGAGYTANYQLFPDTEAEGDYVVFGAAIPFCELWFDLSATVAVYGADSVAWKYWNGTAWAALTLAYDHTDADDGDGDRPFQQDGAITFVPPADWAASTIDGQEAYWIQAVCTATVNITTIPLLDSHEHYVVVPTDPPVMPHSGTITSVRLVDQSATAHTAADVKFLLYNLTTGAHSGELTFPQDKRQDIFSSLTLAVSNGDKIGVLVTQEDGTNEVSFGVLEIQMTLT
jgi:hypothetical protein